MRAAHSPEAFGIALDPEEMDVMVEVWRMFVRDYEATEVHAAMLVQLEEAYQASGRERAGGRMIDMRFILGEGLDLPQLPAPADEDEGGTAVSA